MRSQRSVYRDAVRTVEVALGRTLRGEERVHHVDENPWNNVNSNLVVCPDQAYHYLLHVRQKAYEATGHAELRLCDLCHCYDHPTRMSSHARKNRPNLVYRHKSCNAERSQRTRNEAKESKLL